MKTEALTIRNLEYSKYSCSVFVKNTVQDTGHQKE